MHDHGDEHTTKAGHPLADELDRLHDERDAAIAQRDELRAVVARLRYRVHVTTSRTPVEPIAAFQYADMAGQWARDNYPGRFEIRGVAEAGGDR